MLLFCFFLFKSASFILQLPNWVRIYGGKKRLYVKFENVDSHWIQSSMYIQISVPLNSQSMQFFFFFKLPFVFFIVNGVRDMLCSLYLNDGNGSLYHWCQTKQQRYLYFGCHISVTLTPFQVTIFLGFSQMLSNTSYSYPKF